MLLHQVKNLSSEQSTLESELRAFERVIQRLTTNEVHATQAPNTSQPPPGLFGSRGFSEPTSGPSGIRSSAEPTPGSSGSHGISVKSSNHPTYEGKRSLHNVTAFLFAFERHFKNAAQAIGWVSMTGWGDHAVLQLKGDAAVWAMHRFPMSAPIEWSTFCKDLKAKFIPSNALDLVKRECEELSLKMGERITEFDELFRRLHSKLDLPQPMPAEMLAAAYGYKIKMGNKGVYKTWFVILACAIGLQPSNSAWNTSPHWTRLSTSLNLEVAPTLPQLLKLQLGRWTPRNVVQLAQLARPMTTA